MDEACKKHDIAYSQHRDVETRNKADRKLADEAWERVKAGDSSLGEKATAWAVTNVMKAKSKLGMGFQKQTKKTSKRRKKVKRMKKTKKNLTFNDVVRETKKELKNSKSQGMQTALKIAKKVVRKSSKKVTKPRVIPLVQGGVLPLLPIFAALGAIGSLIGGTSQVTKVVKEAAAARQQLEESKRHNQKMEAIAIGGRGFFLKPYKKGYGLFLKNPKN